jgi:tetratricopeptide (TPR) repeat protein
MNRSGLYVVLVSLLVQVSPARAQDRIRYLDRATKKEGGATGSIQEESPSRVSYRAGPAGTLKTIPALDILDIAYEVPGSVRLDYNRAASDERKADVSAKDEEQQKALSDAIQNYQALLPKLSGDKLKYARRHLEYKIARLMVRQAEDDRAQLDTAIEALDKFRKEHPDGWQIIPCAKLLARLQLEKGDPAAAQKAYEELAGLPELPKETKQECDLLAAEAMIWGKKSLQAEQKLQAVLKGLSADDPQAVRARLYLAECLASSGKLPAAVSQLEGIIAQTTDKDVKALAYNVLGDCYRLNGKPKDALWPYLWVDVIYHQNKEEHLKAMAQLAKLFESQGDEARAKAYKDRLKRESR